MIKEPEKAIFEISNIQLDSEAVRTKTIETRCNECEIYLHIIHFPLSLSSLPPYQAEFKYIEKGLLILQPMARCCSRAMSSLDL